MYTNSDMQVRWKSEHSNVFPLMNGVKQGCCLSPVLFTLYLDGLIQNLKHSGIYSIGLLSNPIGKRTINR